jgi:hypothetical protein
MSEFGAGRRSGTVDAYREALNNMGLPAFLVQHFCAIALD